MNRILTVTDINNYIKQVVSNDVILSDLFIKGEISNFKHHYSGHMYFTLKDENSILKCVMFKANAAALRFIPENGMKVIIRGYISVFERDGQYQLYAGDMQPDGLGALHLAFEQLKNKLEKEGLFNPEIKKPLPMLPKSIGIVTSSTGSVIRDIINVAGRRNKNIKLVLFPVAVQGTQAAGQIAAAISKLNEMKQVDVIIVARGGGSLEELWAFNEEIVARSIFASSIPVVSAVGHETDYTISDFASDVRAPTPSAAAELVVPDLEILLYKLKSYNARMNSALTKKLDDCNSRLSKIRTRPIFRQPYDALYHKRLMLDNYLKHLIKNIEMINKDKKSQFCLLAGKLDTLSPLKILQRGYSVSRSNTGQTIKSISQVTAGDSIIVEIKDGIIDCNVIAVREDNKV